MGEFSGKPNDKAVDLSKIGKEEKIEEQMEASFRGDDPVTVDIEGMVMIRGMRVYDPKELIGNLKKAMVAQKKVMNDPSIYLDRRGVRRRKK